MTEQDLVQTLEAIADRAARAQASVATGAAKTGVAALKKIEDEARDAVRHYHRDEAAEAELADELEDLRRRQSPHPRVEALAAAIRANAGQDVKAGP